MVEDDSKRSAEVASSHGKATIATGVASAGATLWALLEFANSFSGISKVSPATIKKVGIASAVTGIGAAMVAVHHHSRATALEQSTKIDEAQPDWCEKIGTSSRHGVYR